jgi:parallel beta-helix repeat protein
MKRFSFPVVIVSFLLLLSSTLFQVSIATDQETIRVPADYPSIQEAINAAASGSTILVDSGIYYEHLIVNKTLTLIGQDNETIIYGNKKETVVHIKANNVTINGFTVQNGERGIRLTQSNYSTISNNLVILNDFLGIHLYNSSNNLIDSNLILTNGHPSDLWYGEGIRLEFSNNNTVVNNRLSRNVLCNVNLLQSSNNMIHHNNFFLTVLSGHVVERDAFSENIWDDGAAGNYWDNYKGLDDGSSGRIIGDGVGDTRLPHLEVDNYPLICPLQPIPVVWENMVYPVSLLSNSTVSKFRFVKAEKKITFDVGGPSDTVGYCNVTIPKNLLRDNPWKILVNNTNIASQATIIENQTHTSIYFTYNHSAYNIQIVGTWTVPEFSTTMILSLLMTFSTLAVIFIKRIGRQPKT